MRQKLDAERKTESETERDGVLVEVNFPQRASNDRRELGGGLWEGEREREKLEEIKTRPKRRSGRVVGKVKTERGKGDKRGQKWKNLSAKCSSSHERDRPRRSPVFFADGHLVVFSAH